MINILFLNLQGANPFEEGESGQAAGRVQKTMEQYNADVLIFCEVGDNALIDAEIESVKVARVCEYVAQDVLKQSLYNPTASMTATQLKLYRTAADALGFDVTGRRSGMRFSTRTASLRANFKMRKNFTSVSRFLEKGKVDQGMGRARAHPRVVDTLKRAPIKKSMVKYRRWIALDSDQKNRNYMVFTNLAVTMSQEFVKINKAKRNIIKLDFANGFTIFAVHAPAFGKGGGETVKQLSDLVKAESAKQPALAIGDFNIDCEEFMVEVGEDPQAFPNFTHNLISLYTPAATGGKTQYKRRWHAQKGTIVKKIPATQKSGGTLDYVVAPVGSKINVSIQFPPSDLSDHALIQAEWS